MQRRAMMLAALAAIAMNMPTMAQAYVGPGMGVGAVTAVLGVVAALFFAVVGLIWYPIKRLGRRLFASRNAEPPAQE